MKASRYLIPFFIYLLEVNLDGKNPIETMAEKIVTGDGPNRPRLNWIARKIPRQNVSIPRNGNNREDCRAIKKGERVQNQAREVLRLKCRLRKNIN